MDDRQLAVLEDLRRDLTTINMTMAKISAYTGRAIWHNFGPPPSSRPLPIHKTGEGLPWRKDLCDPTALYYRCHMRHPDINTVDNARLNGFVTVQEFVKDLSFSASHVYLFIKNQPEAEPRGCKGATIFINKSLLTERLSKTKTWQLREKKGKLFFASRSADQ